MLDIMPYPSIADEQTKVGLAPSHQLTALEPRGSSHVAREFPIAGRMYQSGHREASVVLKMWRVLGGNYLFEPKAILAKRVSCTLNKQCPLSCVGFLLDTIVAFPQLY